MDITTQKQQFRSNIKTIFNQCSSEELSTFSKDINQKIEKLIEAKNWRKISFFAPLNDEPNIWPSIEGYLNSPEKQQLFFPKIDNETLVFRQITAVVQLMSGLYGVREPIDNLPTIEPEKLDVIFVPGVAFDRAGYRLGRGRGYYDRVIAQLDFATVTTIGVCFPFQVFESIPTDEEDQKVDQVIS